MGLFYTTKGHKSISILFVSFVKLKQTVARVYYKNHGLLSALEQRIITNRA